MKARILPFLAVLLIPGLVFAQQQGTVTGAVVDGETGEPLPGATVQVPDVGTGSATDAEGNFRFQIEPGEYQVEASFVGFQTAVRSIEVTAGSTTRVRFQLGVTQAKLDEVVVTGQQVNRQARSLGYSVSTVGGADVERASDENLVKSLSGKIAGVTINSQSGNVGGGANILLRGITSIGGSNQPLFVIDGVPVSNSNIAFGDAQRLSGTVDTGNRAGQFSPNNIESISVLKSGAAAALYGQRAKNGVILIETKKGTEGRAGASFSTSMSLSQPMVLPDFQNTYGPGDAGKYDIQDLDGWGPEMNGQNVEIFTGETVPLEPGGNPVENFYDTGTVLENNVSFSNASESIDYRLGLTSNNTRGIVPGSELDRYNVNFNTGATTLDDDLEARVTGTYIKESTLGRAVSGGNDPNVLTSLVNGLPRNLSASTLRNNYEEAGSQISLTPDVNNPFWIVNKNRFETDAERFYGSATVSYDVFDWLTLREKFGTDVISEERRQPTSAGTVGQPTGAFRDQILREREINHDFTIRTDNQFGEFSLQSIFGHNINQRSLEEVTNDATNLTIPGVRSYPNANSNAPDNYFEKQRIIGAYGSATIGFREYAYLELTGRNDWSSTLPPENRSYFYPSASLSVIFTDLLETEFDTGIPGISYGKIRANYAEVGGDTDPYELSFRYFPVADLFTQFVDNFTFPYQGVAAFEKTGTYPPSNLKPQRQKSWEIGTELGFFDGRVNLDLTYYDQRTEDQILDLPVPFSTGYFDRTTNAGTLVNNGVETSLQVSVFTGEQFRWRIDGNYSRNRTTVENLPEGLQEVELEAGFNSAEFRIQPGERPTIYGPGLERTEDGQLIIDPEDGLPNEGDARDLGTLYPDFRAGLTNTIGVGNFTLRALLDWKEGGSVFSATVQDLRGSGLAAETAEARGGSFVIDEGVIVTERDAAGNIVETRPNDAPVTSMSAYWGALTSTVGPNVFDASFIKLREVSLTYSFPQSWFEQTSLTSGSFQVQGRNLLLLHSNVPHIDPETNVFGSAGGVGQGYEFNTVPNTTTIGATLNLTF